jgi:hypothetical protein
MAADNGDVQIGQALLEKLNGVLDLNAATAVTFRVNIAHCMLHAHQS